MTDSPPVEPSDAEFCSTQGAGLHLAKTADKSSAKTGDVLLYTIVYTNHSNGSLTQIKIFDATPAYTVFAGAACGTLGAGLTNCALTGQPAVGVNGSVEWTLTVPLLSGASGTVSFQVTVQ